MTCRFECRNLESKSAWESRASPRPEDLRPASTPSVSFDHLSCRARVRSRFRAIGERGGSCLNQFVYEAYRVER